MSRTQVQVWHRWFKEGRENVNNGSRPSTSTTDDNIEAMKKMIMDNSRITIREISGNVGILFGSCQAIFTDVLQMNRATTKIVPKLLNFEQKQRHMDTVHEMLTIFNDDPDLLKRIITGDES